MKAKDYSKKKRLCILAAMLGSAAGGFATPVLENDPAGGLSQEPDSMKVRELNELVVRAVRAPKNAPFAVSRIDSRELQQFSQTGQELPFLFARTPGVLAWSENGLGTGTTYMRIRGSADSRINVTLDGVSLNSPEDQCVFWANMNSYASLLGSVQIQRGVGSSTNGDGAFGGSIALSTKAPSLAPTMELSASYGSYNTYHAGGSFSSGLLWDHLVLDGAYHHTGTQGYLHGTGGNSGSYYAGLTYFNNAGTVKLSYKNIGNYEHTGQAWNGVVTDMLTYKDVYKAGLGRFNNLYERLTDEGSMERYQMADGSLWKRTTDNFWQNHNILSMALLLDDHWSASGALHYTRGQGYYDEFRYRNKLKKFGLGPFTLSDGTPLEKTDFVRQKGLTQDTYGMLWNFNYQSDQWDAVMGAAFQNFEGTHYGYLTYVANEELWQALQKTESSSHSAGYKYYDSGADKSDASVFLKGTYHLNDHWDFFGDVQYRHVGFMTSGINDKFYKQSDGTYANQRLDISRQYDFLNPKVGVSYHRKGHNVYASYALSHREPERNNFTDNGSYPAPKAESLHDVEAGYDFSGKVWHAGANLYFMRYHNQFVQTGELSDIGENLTTNVEKSYRLGVELTAGVNVTKWLSLEANAALSQNRILSFDEVASVDWEESFCTIHYDHSTLAFSPAAILNGFADFHFRDFTAQWHTALVSKQYLDNTGCDVRSLPAYCRTDVAFSYDLKWGRKGKPKHTVFGLNLNNIFNSHYASSGWVYSSIMSSSSSSPVDDRYTQIGFIPMAGFTMMGSITFKF